MKKAISVFLAVLMFVSIMPLSAFAEGDVFVSQISNSVDDPDFTVFEKMLNASWGAWGTVNDYSRLPLEELITQYITCPAIPQGLYMFFSGSAVPYTGGSYKSRYEDPKGKFFMSYELDSDLADWILINVFNAKPNRNIISNSLYYFGQKLYVAPTDLGGGPGFVYKVFDYELFDNNYYKLMVSCSINYGENDHVLIGFIEFEAKPKTNSKYGVFWEIKSSRSVDNEVVDSGYCGVDGDNVAWTLFNNGMLYIEGQGEMCDWSIYNYENRPWQKYLSQIKCLYIDNGITHIGDISFYKCERLKSVSMPESLCSLGYCSFEYCNALESITIPKNVSYIDTAFCSCANLDNIFVAFDNAYYSEKDGVLFNKNQTELIRYPAGKQNDIYTIPESVERINADSFSFSKNIETVIMSENVLVVDEFAFFACESLTNVIISNRTTKIGDSVFDNCKRLESITISDSVTLIGNWAFNNCDSLTTVYYTGTKEQWNSIDFGYGNECLTSAKKIVFNSNGTGIESNQSIAILTTEKSLCVAVGDTFNLGFAVMNNTTGLLESEWKKMAVVISDTSIISLSEYETEEYGYSIDVTGKKIGSTNVTVTDTESGISTSFVVTVKEKYNKSYSYDIENISTFYPSNKWESDIPTNIYDLNGLYVNNYKCEKKGDKYYISMDVYNQRYHTAAIDIYNENGEWVDCEPIEKFSDISSISDTIEQIYYLIADPITGKWLTYEQSMSSKHTSIKDIEVPEGGYFTISNNYLESPGTFLFNASEILFNGTCTLIHLITDDEIKFWEFSGLLKESVVKNKDIRKDFYEMFIDAAEKEITDYTKNILEGNIDNACAGLSGLLENMLSSLKIEWKHLFNSVMGVGQSIFTYFSGAAGIALKGCFEITDLSSQLLQARHLAVSSKASYVTVYSEIAEDFINPHGLIINTNGNIDAESVLQVFKIFDEDIINTIPGNSLSNYELYNICFVKNDELVQPNGKVKVQIPIPLGFDSDSCKIYRQESNGSWTELMSHVEGNYLVFETDHFSLYAISGVSAELSVYSLPEKIAYKSGEILSTDGLVLEINGELITSGYICNPAVISGCGTQTVTVTYGRTQTTFNVMSHTPGSWEVVVEAQVGKDGLEQQKCTVCGEIVDEKVIPALPDYLVGDANGDGKITAADARIALRISAKVDSLEKYNLTAEVLDVTGDGKLTAADARKILRIAAKIE